MKAELIKVGRDNEILQSELEDGRILIRESTDRM